MGIYLSITDMEELFRSCDPESIIILNDVMPLTTFEKKMVNESIYTINDQNIYDMAPRCMCTKTKGRYQLGIVCPECNTKVVECVGDDIRPSVWVRRIRGVESYMVPQVWHMLRKHFCIGGVGRDGQYKFDTIAYLTDRSYRPLSNYKHKNMERLIEDLDKAGLRTRSYNNFVRRFDDYMEFLLNNRIYTTKYRTKDEDEANNHISMEKMINMYRDRIFTHYLPLPNKALLVIESNQHARYIDKSMSHVVDAARLIQGIDIRDDLSDSKREEIASKLLCKLSSYYRTLFTTYFTPKSGLLRKHVYGTRCDYTFRTVISSISGSHRYDEIHVPWAVAVNVLYNDIVSKLLHRGFTPKQTFEFIRRYNTEYNSLLHEILEELISEAPDGLGIPVIQNRNPSLGRTSIQNVYITKVKTDVTDNTTSLSILICPAYNADFDGDEINHSLAIDNRTAEYFRYLSPETNIFDLNHIHQPSGVISMPKPVAACLGVYLSDDGVDEDNPKMDALLA